jgi:two-component system phosphate regulon response regulator PhoB
MTASDMKREATLVLAVAQAGLADELLRAMPSAGVVEIGPSSTVPPLPAGPVWCFIDWLLEDISGLELCRRLRAAPDSARAHITLVLEELDGDSRRRALKAGADDYVLGPLSFEMLADRLGLRSVPAGAGQAGESLFHGELELDPIAHRAFFAGRPVDLQPKQFELLAHFMRHPNRVHSRASLLDVLGKQGADLDERTVDVWVGRLRWALQASGAAPPIRTVKGYGYVFDRT